MPGAHAATGAARVRHAVECVFLLSALWLSSSSFSLLLYSPYLSPPTASVPPRVRVVRAGGSGAIVAVTAAVDHTH